MYRLGIWQALASFTEEDMRALLPLVPKGFQQPPTFSTTGQAVIQDFIGRPVSWDLVTGRARRR